MHSLQITQYKDVGLIRILILLTVFIYFWFLASLSNLGQLGGSLATGVLSNWLGRRPTIILLCIPLLSGWITVGLSGGSVVWICIGRVLQGIGIMSSVTQVYLVEIADAKRRYL